jgi:hypothetical protein
MLRRAWILQGESATAAVALRADGDGSGQFSFGFFGLWELEMFAVDDSFIKLGFLDSSIFLCFSHHQEIGILVTLRYLLYPLVVLRHALPLGCQSSLRYFAYGPQTANLAEVFMSMMVAQLVSVKTGEWHKIWKPKPLNLGQSNCACVAISQDLKQVSEMKV